MRKKSPLRNEGPFGADFQRRGFLKTHYFRAAKRLNLYRFHPVFPSSIACLLYLLIEDEHNRRIKILTQKQGCGIVPLSQASVAQLDRASVFGTDINSTQTTDNNQVIKSKETDSPNNSLSRFEVPAELQKIIVQWQSLPEHVRQTIKMLVDTAGKNSDSLNDLGEI